MLRSTIFLRHAGAAKAGVAAGGGKLEGILASLLAAARAEWPRLAVKDEDFLRHMAQKLPSEDPVKFLGSIHAADLFLACACTAGTQTALNAFDERYLAPVAAYFTSRMAGLGTIEDLKQGLRVRLFVANEGAIPRISTYTGQVSLKTWLRTVASHFISNMRRDEPGPASKDDVDHFQAPGPDPEINYLKQRYSRELGEAFRATLAGLPEREAVFLRLHYLESVNMDTIAGMFRISRSTVHRSISRAKRNIFARTRKHLMAHLKISDAEFETLAGFVRSQLDVNLVDVLRTAAPTDPRR